MKSGNLERPMASKLFSGHVARDGKTSRKINAEKPNESIRSGKRACLDLDISRFFIRIQENLGCAKAHLGCAKAHLGWAQKQVQLKTFYSGSQNGPPETLV